MSTEIVINKCFGGFGLSPLGLKRYAELKGRKCFLFTGGLIEAYEPMAEGAESSFMWNAFDVETLPKWKHWSKQTESERTDWSNFCSEHIISQPEDRSDPDLVKVVRELGKKANGSCADLKVVKVPDGVEWEIKEYDGSEHIAESHRTWS